MFFLPFYLFYKKSFLNLRQLKANNLRYLSYYQTDILLGFTFLKENKYF